MGAFFNRRHTRPLKSGSTAQPAAKPTLVDDMLNAWMSADTAKLETLLNGNLDKKYPGVRKVLLDDRNADWLKMAQVTSGPVPGAPSIEVATSYIAMIRSSYCWGCWSSRALPASSVSIHIIKPVS